jgi:hypothetical protein
MCSLNTWKKKMEKKLLLKWWYESQCGNLVVCSLNTLEKYEKNNGKETTLEVMVWKINVEVLWRSLPNVVSNSCFLDKIKAFMLNFTYRMNVCTTYVVLQTLLPCWIRVCKRMKVLQMLGCNVKD